MVFFPFKTRLMYDGNVLWNAFSSSCNFLSSSRMCLIVPIRSLAISDGPFVKMLKIAFWVESGTGFKVSIGWCKFIALSKNCLTEWNCPTFEMPIDAPPVVDGPSCLQSGGSDCCLKSMSKTFKNSGMSCGKRLCCFDVYEVVCIRRLQLSRGWMGDGQVCMCELFAEPFAQKVRIGTFNRSVKLPNSIQVYFVRFMFVFAIAIFP